MKNTLHSFHTLPAPCPTSQPLAQQFKLANLLLIITILFLFCGNVNAGNENGYTLSPDDEVSITVFGEPDLSLTKTRIATNGTISVPLLGQVLVQGLTTAQTEEKLARLFADGYLIKPAITVSITEYRQFYVNGEVKKPGGYSYREGLTVEIAITLAGGFSERASKNKITLAHEENKGNARRVELTTPIRPGDVITVEESFF